MKTLLTFFVLGLILIACGNTSDERSKAQQTVTIKIDGEKLYKNYCITCHGLYGNMGASGAHDLTTSQLSLEERILVITKGRNLMTPFEGLLSAEKIKAIAEYSIKLKK